MIPLDLKIRKNTAKKEKLDLIYIILHLSCNNEIWKVYAMW